MKRSGTHFKYKPLVILSILMMSFASYSVAKPHQEIWFKGNLVIPIHKKVKIQNVFEHKRQSGFDNNNPFSKHSVFSFKPWISYQHNKNITFGLSPVSYNAYYPLIKQASDEY